ncbi:MAG TPA: VOC family protein [Candidatus Binatia bacterium]|nr:VOC family protein [Candidatus Binatia bacterium]
MVEINGIAHLFLTVSRFEEARNFYRELLTFMGMVPVIDADQMLYCVGGRTAVGIEPVGEAYTNDRFVQQRVGLHHLCFRARNREDVDKFYEKAVSLGAKIVHAPEDGPWAPGYYSVLVEDPDGIRLEMNFVPGKGLLEPKS